LHAGYGAALAIWVMPAGKLAMPRLHLGGGDLLAGGET
jgi:hypothetical protein